MPLPTWLLRLEWQPLDVRSVSGSLREQLPQISSLAEAESGDVLISVLDGDDDLGIAAEAFTLNENIIGRTPEVTDIYRCRLADRILEGAGSSRAHHTQLRAFNLEGSPLLQVAMYPRPGSVHGVRLWCDPALIWLFLPRATLAVLRPGLAALQPSWERLRAHHGVPLTHHLRADLADRYPVEDPMEPLRPDELRRLGDAVEMLVGQSCVQALLDGSITPRQAVDSTLQARRSLARHLDRLDKLLEHSHGRADTKMELLAESASRIFSRSTEHDVLHLLAPHQHLVDGMEETHDQVSGAVQGASATTALMSSAAVGRLLDRSQANRAVTTAVAVAAFLIAVVTGFTSLASVPMDDRAIRDLVRLAGFVGVGSAVLVATAYSLAKVAAAPARSAPEVLQRWAVASTVLGLALTIACFGLGAATGEVWALAAGGGVAIFTAFLRAWIDDY